MYIKVEYLIERRGFMNGRERAEAWVRDNPTAWMELTFKEIGELLDISTPYADRVIPRIIAERDGITEQEARKRRNEFRSK